MSPEHAARRQAFEALPGWVEHRTLARYLENSTDCTPGVASALLADVAAGRTIILPPPAAHSSSALDGAFRLHLAGLGYRLVAPLNAPVGAPAAASQPPAPKPDPAAGWKAAFAKATERSAFTI